MFDPALTYSFTEDSDGVIRIENKGRIEDYRASITFPTSLADHLAGNGLSEVGLFLSFYKTGALFPLKHNITQNDGDSLLRVSSVVAATFAGQELQNLQDDVIITFKLDYETEPNVTCVSWDFNANGEEGKKTHPMHHV